MVASGTCRVCQSPFSGIRSTASDLDGNIDSDHYRELVKCLTFTKLPAFQSQGHLYFSVGLNTRKRIRDGVVGLSQGHLYFSVGLNSNDVLVSRHDRPVPRISALNAD